jgi:pSer/pThr/pTyr-binding forkhead associated (FHA) protein
VLGRSRECDITLDDPNVSRRHAEVRQEEGAHWIVDLGSTNGVTLNGKRVNRARLEPDDAILVGTTELRFERGY